MVHLLLGFPGGSDGKASAQSAGDLGLILGLERSPGEGNGNSLQYSCLEKSVGQESPICGVPKSWTQLKRLTVSLHLSPSAQFLLYFIKALGLKGLEFETMISYYKLFD